MDYDPETRAKNHGPEAHHKWTWGQAQSQSLAFKVRLHLFELDTATLIGKNGYVPPSAVIPKNPQIM